MPCIHVHKENNKGNQKAKKLYQLSNEHKHSLKRYPVNRFRCYVLQNQYRSANTLPFELAKSRGKKAS